MTVDRKDTFGNVCRTYVKIGSSLLQTDMGRLDHDQFYCLAKELSELRKSGSEVSLTSSGATEAGRQKAGVTTKIKDMSTEERAYFSSIGQAILMQHYIEAFGMFDQNVGQILLDSQDLRDREKSEHFVKLYRMYADKGAIPIFNNNDSVSTAELGGYTENDRLLADLVKAIQSKTWKKSAAIILSEYDLHDQDPRKCPTARRIPVYDPKVAFEVSGSSESGFGGMKAKVKYAKEVSDEGIPTVIVDGKYKKDRKRIIQQILKGEDIGTLFMPK